MIKVFRKIRQRLLAEDQPSSIGRRGKLSKYLLYAIGEIILVVIGILIALQINTWNEWRKDRIKEMTVLEGIVSNIEINIETFQQDIAQLELWNKSSNVVLDALKKRLSYSDTLRQHLHFARVTKQNLFISTTGFQAYKDEGLDIIRNKDLSVEIIKLYEVTIPRIIATNDLVNEGHREWDNHNVLNFDFVEGVGLTPNDYEALSSDHYYISWIRAYKEGRKDLIAVDRDLIAECEKARRLVKNELVNSSKYQLMKRFYR